MSLQTVKYYDGSIYSFAFHVTFLLEHKTKERKGGLISFGFVV